MENDLKMGNIWELQSDSNPEIKSLTMFLTSER